MKLVKVGTLLATAGLVLGGCTSTPVAEPAPAPAPAPVAAAPAPAPAAAPAPVEAPKVVAAHLDPNSMISKERSVFFDFDKFDIKNEYTALVERHGKYLSANPGLAIKIEGNADERGSSEYNLALGQKRAEAVLKALTVYGVKASSMEAVSWGEERPKANGHDEAAWAQNRRADLAYPQK